MYDVIHTKKIFFYFIKRNFHESYRCFNLKILLHILFFSFYMNLT